MRSSLSTKTLCWSSSTSRAAAKRLFGNLSGPLVIERLTDLESSAHLTIPTYGGLDDRIELYQPDERLTLLPGLQPYIKLHGSIDIKQSDREMMLVIGGDKAANIDRQPLLKWYNQVFQHSLRSREARLMIIGYSFGDAHINQVIFSGVEAGLKIFIIDPRGVDIIGSNPSLPLNPGFPIRNAIIGASRRSLHNTFSMRDMVERQKINRFFRTGPFR